MKNLKSFLLLILFFALSHSIIAQNLKKTVTDDEVKYISEVFNKISISDQKYRNYLSSETMDEGIIATIDSILNNVGVKEGIEYQKSLNLSLSKHIKDSLWALQHQLDFQNHMTIRGIWKTYGYIPKSLIKENNSVQILLLLHPPKDWDIPAYHKEYTTFLLNEVHEGRMPPKTYAMFYDNILCKIMNKPQRYGTNEQFDPKQGKILPPIIEDLTVANNARAAIGLPLLNEGEYRLKK